MNHAAKFADKFEVSGTLYSRGARPRFFINGEERFWGKSIVGMAQGMQGFHRSVTIVWDDAHCGWMDRRQRPYVRVRLYEGGAIKFWYHRNKRVNRGKPKELHYIPKELVGKVRHRLSVLDAAANDRGFATIKGFGERYYSQEFGSLIVPHEVPYVEYEVYL